MNQSCLGFIFAFNKYTYEIHSYKFILKAMQLSYIFIITYIYVLYYINVFI